MQKKYVVIGAIALILVAAIAGGIFAFKKVKTATTPQDTGPQKKRIALPVNVIPVTERPVMAISPSSSGKNITITVEALNKPAEEVELELEYQAGTLLQGYQGLLDVAALPAKQELLLGSCSAGGACTYHEDVTGGTLLASFRGADEYAVKSDWRFIENTEKEEKLASKDGKFSIEAPEIAKIPYTVIFNSPGYESSVPGTVVAEHYAVRFSTSGPDEATVSIRATEEGELKVVGWNGSEWQELETTVAEKVATATGPIMQLYTVVK